MNILSLNGENNKEQIKKIGLPNTYNDYVSAARTVNVLLRFLKFLKFLFNGIQLNNTFVQIVKEAYKQELVKFKTNPNFSTKTILISTYLRPLITLGW